MCKSIAAWTSCPINSFLHETLKRYYMEKISEFWTSKHFLIFHYSLDVSLCEKKLSLYPLHLSLFHAKAHFWNMAFLFKRKASINVCRELNATASSASAFCNFQYKFLFDLKIKSLSKSLCPSFCCWMHNYAFRAEYTQR